jgi:hypothetical protein
MELFESTQLVDAIEAEIAMIEGVCADDKINIKDLVPLLKASPTLAAGVNGCWLIPSELAVASAAGKDALLIRVAALLPRLWAAHVKLLEVLQAKAPA